MILQIAINRKAAKGRYSDILDVAEHLAGGEYGSATNALAALVRQSELYKETAKELGVSANRPRRKMTKSRRAPVFHEEHSPGSNTN